MSNLGTLISDRLTQIGQEPAALRRELERVGAKVSRQSLHAWMSGRRRPSHAHILALLDVLLVPLEEQRDWHEAAAAWRDPGPSESSNRASNRAEVGP